MRLEWFLLVSEFLRFRQIELKILKGSRTIVVLNWWGVSDNRGFEKLVVLTEVNSKGNDLWFWKSGVAKNQWFHWIYIFYRMFFITFSGSRVPYVLSCSLQEDWWWAGWGGCCISKKKITFRSTGRKLGRGILKKTTTVLLDQFRSIGYHKSYTIAAIEIQNEHQA